MHSFSGNPIPFEAMMGYLFFSPRTAGETITKLLSRYRTALSTFLDVLNQHTRAQREADYEAALVLHQKRMIVWLAEVQEAERLHAEGGDPAELADLLVKLLEPLLEVFSSEEARWPDLVMGFCSYTICRSRGHSARS